jgi:hypothetical protein
VFIHPYYSCRRTSLCDRNWHFVDDLLVAGNSVAEITEVRSGKNEQEIYSVRSREIGILFGS